MTVVKRILAGLGTAVFVLIGLAQCVSDTVDFVRRPPLAMDETRFLPRWTTGKPLNAGGQNAKLRETGTRLRLTHLTRITRT